MAKYLIIQDSHCQGKNSLNRRGDYFADWLTKWDEILSIAKKNKCEAILDGGDLFESKNPSYNVIDEVADRTEKSGIHVLSLFGNHAMNAGHIENSENTGLAHLQKRSKYFDYLDAIAGKDFIISGFDYAFGIEEKLKNDGIMLTARGHKTWNVCLVHALITPKKFFDNVSHVTPEQIKTNANLVIVAHYHHPYEIKVGNTTFLNIGCGGRLKINEAHIEPSVLLINTDKRSYEVIKLQSAKPASEIFDLDKYEELKEQEKSIDDFIHSLSSAEWTQLDILGQIEKIGKTKNVEKKVIDYILEKVGKQ